MLLEIFFDPEEIFDDEREFAKGQMPGAGAVEKLPIDPAAVGPAQQERSVGGEALLDEMHDQRLEGDAGALECADGEDEVEVFLPEAGEIVEVEPEGPQPLRPSLFGGVQGASAHRD